MEKLTDILARTGKATARELAAIMKIDAPDALNMLRELQEEGAVYRDGAHWSLPAEPGLLPDEPQSLPLKPEILPVRQENLPVKPEILPGAAVADKAGTSRQGADALLELLAAHVAMTSEELAKMAGVTARKVASTLAMPTSKGRVLRQQKDGKFRYCLPEQKAVVSAREEVTAPAASTEPEVAAVPAPAPATEPAAAAVPLKVVWSAPEDFQVFPTRAWVRQQRRALQQEEREFNRAMKNKKRTLAQIDNLVRRVTRIQGGVARIEGQV